MSNYLERGLRIRKQGEKKEEPGSLTPLYSIKDKIGKLLKPLAPSCPHSSFKVLGFQMEAVDRFMRQENGTVPSTSSDTSFARLHFEK